VSRELIDSVQQEPCRCVYCGVCGGSGQIKVEDRSQPEGWDLDTCYACDGSGLEDVCERCLFLEEIDQEEL
jgi:DnaJ-class molecular chaperone